MEGADILGPIPFSIETEVRSACVFRRNAQFPGMRSESAASEENP
jgi:hypothetical protein